MCIKTKGAIDDLLDQVRDRRTRREMLAEISDCGNCKFGKAFESQPGEVTCLHHLVEFRNIVLYHTREISSKDELTNIAPDDTGSQ